MKYSIMEKFLGQLISLGISIYMTRFFSPTDIGYYALATTVVSFIIVFSESGISSSVLVKKDLSLSDLSVLISFVLIIGVIILFAVEIGIYAFGGVLLDGTTCMLIAVLALRIILVPVVNTLSNFLIREENFSLLAKLKLTSVIMGSAAGLVALSRGLGIFSYAVMFLLQDIVALALLLITAHKGLRFMLDRNVIRKYSKYGADLTAIGLFDYVFQLAHAFLLKSVFGSFALGSYWRLNNILTMASKLFSEGILRAYLPRLLRLNDVDLKTEYIRIWQPLMFLYSYLLYGVLSLIPLLLNFWDNGWQEAGIYLKYFLIAALMYPWNYFHFSLIKIAPLDGRRWRYDAVKKILLGVFLMAGYLLKSIELFMLTYSISAVISWLVNVYLLQRTIGMDLRLEIKVLMSSLGLGIPWVITMSYIDSNMVYIGLMLLYGIGFIIKFREVYRIYA
jgi:O-antigen/teichoic acid export membrane protein